MDYHFVFEEALDSFVALASAHLHHLANQVNWDIFVVTHSQLNSSQYSQLFLRDKWQI